MTTIFDLTKMRKFCLAGMDHFTQYGDVSETPDGKVIFIDRGAPVLAIAHLDTVCNPKGRFRFDPKRQMVQTPTLDDRLGVTILLDILPRILGSNEFDVLLTEGEEIGRSTAAWFDPSRDYNWMFSFDRTGTDAVHYQYDNDPWMEALTSGMGGMQINTGIMSDISFMDHLGCSGVNVGCAYYKYHSPNAFANLRETKSQIGKFCRFFLDNKDTRFEHDAYAPTPEDYYYGDDEDDDDVVFELESDSRWGDYLDYCDDCLVVSRVTETRLGYRYCRTCFGDPKHSSAVIDLQSKARLM